MHPGSSPGQAAEHADNRELNELSGRVIGCAITVLNTLGAGFLEKVYESAFAYEVRAARLSAVQQYAARVQYKDILVGEYFTDLLVNDVLLVELKTVKALNERAPDAMHQLSQSDRPAALPAV
jgi:GxxExxY protein